METITNKSSQASTGSNEAVPQDIIVDLARAPGAASLPPPEPGPTEPEQLPEPIFTNDEFCQLIAPIIYSAVADDLPPEAIDQLPSPKLLKLALDMIQFDRASGMLEGVMKMDPKRTLIVGLVATGAWTAWVVVKANTIRNQLKKKGLYQDAKARAMETKRKEYEELAERLRRMHGSQEGNKGSNTGEFGVGQEHARSSDSPSVSEEKSQG